LNTQEGTLKIPLRQISHIEGDRNYSYIHLSNGRNELSSKTLGYFEEILSDKGFLRCHRSFLVSKNQIEQLTTSEFKLKNETTIPISRRKLTVAKDWFTSA
jgi:two-component system LytT family response regulator